MSSELIRLEPNCFRSTIHLTLELFIFSSKPCSQKCTTKNEQDFDGKSRKKEQGHQNISDSIRIHQNPSEPIRTHQYPLLLIQFHQKSSDPIVLNLDLAIKNTYTGCVRQNENPTASHRHALLMMPRPFSGYHIKGENKGY
mgnify:CR=1 FL=1